MQLKFEDIIDEKGQSPDLGKTSGEKKEERKDMYSQIIGLSDEKEEKGCIDKKEVSKRLKLEEEKGGVSNQEESYLTDFD